MSLLFVLCAVLEDYTTTSYAGKNCIRKGTECPVGDVEIPSKDARGRTIEGIAMNGFIGCTGITSVKLPETVSVIYNKAFAGCSSIRTMEIYPSVKTIRQGAFDGCTGMVSFTYYGLSGFGEDIGLDPSTAVFISRHYSSGQFHSVTGFLDNLSIPCKRAGEVKGVGFGSVLLSILAIIAFCGAIVYLFAPWWKLCHYNSFAEV